MILRRIELQGVLTSGVVPIWTAIEKNQSELARAAECWLITQPAHSAVSGDMASKLSESAFGKMDPSLVRAIALHDAGWSRSDAEAIRSSREEIKGRRAESNKKLLSFMAFPVQETIVAWTDSVEVALKSSPIGGFLVSEHFRSIALSANRKEDLGKRMGKFVAQEDLRQKKIRPRLVQSEKQLQSLVDGLLFCDLLSLYLCCGLEEDTEFPIKIKGTNICLKRYEKDACTLSPFPFEADQIFQVHALRHPKTDSFSSSAFHLAVRQKG